MAAEKNPPYFLLFYLILGEKERDFCEKLRGEFWGFCLCRGASGCSGVAGSVIWLFLFIAVGGIFLFRGGVWYLRQGYLPTNMSPLELCLFPFLALFRFFLGRGLGWHCFFLAGRLRGILGSRTDGRFPFGAKRKRNALKGRRKVCFPPPLKNPLPLSGGRGDVGWFGGLMGLGFSPYRN